MKLRSLRLAGALALLPILSLSAQSTPDSAECRAVLHAATRDSQLIRILLHVRPFDSVSVKMSTAFQAVIGDGIKMYLQVPRPLALTAYNTTIEGLDGKTNQKLATVTMMTSFVAMLHRDGRFSGVRALGGTRNPAFDDAMVRAIQTVSDSGALPPAHAPDVVYKGDSVAVRFVVEADETSPASQPITRSPKAGDTPLLLVRVPVRRITQQVAVAPDGRREAPKYPEAARRTRVEGTTKLALVIDATGKVDLSTVDVVQTPALEFVKEILDVLPTHRFTPMMVEGCAVPAFVAMPFEFHLTPP